MILDWAVGKKYIFHLVLVGGEFINGDIYYIQHQQPVQGTCVVIPVAFYMSPTETDGYPIYFETEGP